MRSGQILADASLWALVERGWDARIVVHRAGLASRYPGNREHPRERLADYASDRARLEAVEVQIGERILVGAGVSPSEGLTREHQETFLRGVGQALLRACYPDGYRLIEECESLWDKEEWEALQESDFISQEECAELKLWAARDFQGLLRLGVIEEYEYEGFQREEYLARRERRRKDALVRARDLAGQLEQLGVTRAVSHYNGCGDSAQIEWIQFYAGDAVATVPCPLATALEAICVSLCPDGWEDEVGGSGDLTLDVLQRRLVVEHSDETSARQRVDPRPTVR